VEDQRAWRGRLLVASHEINEIEEGLLQLVSASKMVGLQEFALEPTSPDLDLILPNYRSTGVFRRRANEPQKLVTKYYGRQNADAPFHVLFHG
jgi:hypothetical protein